MRRVGWASRVWRGARSQTFGKVVAASTAGALVIAVASVGTTEAIAAAPDTKSMVDNALYPQTVNGENSNPANDKLSVTVGKSVSITTDPAGIPTLKALVSNTQVSGKGSGKLYVPIGTSSPTNTGGFESLQTEGDTIVYDLNSQGGQVQNLKASGGTFQGQEAVTMKVEAWLDGQPIDPAKMFNITGNVKINYTFTNTTSQQQTVTYKNTAGEEATAKVNIPVPMGAAFSATYGDGWADINAPWADTGISPTGQQLNGTAILFPPIGGITQTLTVEARAQNATLPKSTTTAIPINLGTYSGGLILNVLPQVASLADEGAGLVGKLPSMLVFLQQLLMKFGTAIADINSKYVKPLTDALTSVKVNPKRIDNMLTSAETDADFVANVLGQDANLDAINSRLIGSIANFLKNADKPLDNVIAGLDELEDVVTDLKKPLGQISAMLGDSATLEQLATDMPVFDQACTSAVATNNYYNKQGGKAALQTAIANTSPIFNLQRWASLNAIQAAMNTPSSLSPVDVGQAGTIASIALSGCALLWDGLDPIMKALPGIKNNIDNLILLITSGVIQDWIQGQSSKITDELIPALQEIGNGLDNDNCPTTLKGIMALYKSQGVKGILKNCGLAQASDALGFLNGAISKAITKDIVPGIEKIRGFVPTLYKYDQLALKYAPELEKTVASVPGMMDSYAKLLGGFMPTIQTLDGTVVSAADQISILNASMVAMNDRSLNGGGTPYGNATGAGNPVTLAAWQINQNGAASPTLGRDMINLGVALLIFVIGAGIGTAMYLRRPH